MAANNGIFIGWNRVVPGREEQAVALFREAMAFWNAQQEAGSIDAFETVFLAPHGGELNGFFLIRGGVDNLSKVLASDAYLALEARANYVIEGQGVIAAAFGEEIVRRMDIYQKVIAADG
jgi:hypothetical protein